MNKAEATRINKFLATHFGQLDGRLPVFRLTWSTPETEYLAGAGRVLKYPEYLDRWILERLCESIPELPEFQHTYEPLWVFQHDDGSPQEPNERVVIFLVHTLLYGEAKKRTQGDVDAEQKASEDKEVQRFIDILEEEYPVLSARREVGEALFLPGKEWKSV